MSKAVQSSAEAIRPYLQKWIETACLERPCAVPGDSFFAVLQERLGGDLLGRLAQALREGVIVEKGYRFDVKGAPARDGFLWFSRRSWREFGLHPNWEAFVHADYFFRLCRGRVEINAPAGFEAQGMDLILSRENRPWWNVEVKEKAAAAQSLALGVMQYGRGVQVKIPGGKSATEDAVIKAKRIVDYRPEFFSTVALHYQSHYKVTFGDAMHFTLAETSPPFEF